MSLGTAYELLYTTALAGWILLIGAMLVRAGIGPRISDRILSINMIGTMVICCILILSVRQDEPYLLDIALIYAMISFLSVLILAATYIPSHASREAFGRTIAERVRRQEDLEKSGKNPEESGALSEEGDAR